ncbi:hypothetical protein [Synechococcus sp. CS-1328]|uniref:hypothetical protein n=1 Tax=Synechococcus sp. CS-1328 TaxID=2847976 RepID=UPI00223B7F2E|nr:hypothetical protein [Synechococcus sp. CS-1328]MCT0223854.1 hypothetical protein [Synechococcus sp. CS-1328]
MTSYLTWRRTVLLSTLDGLMASNAATPAHGSTSQEAGQCHEVETSVVFERLERELSRCMPVAEIAATTTDLLTSRRCTSSPARLRMLDGFRRHLLVRQS